MADFFEYKNFSDLIYASAGDDSIDSSFGMDDISGGPGIDTFIYDGCSCFSALARNPWLSSSANSDYTLLLYGRGSNDKYLTSVERVQFTDGLYAIDMRAGQAGWETALIVGGVFGQAGLDNYELVGAVQHFLGATSYSMDQADQVLFDIGVFSSSWSRQTTVAFMQSAIPPTAASNDSTTASGGLIYGGATDHPELHCSTDAVKRESDERLYRGITNLWNALFLMRWWGAC